MLKKWDAKADLRVGSMLALPYPDNFFDVVVDVFSSNCLNQKDFLFCLREVKRVLKKGGRFFSLTPSVNSHAFKNYFPAKKIDEFTLNGIKRSDSPFYGNNYAFRFADPVNQKKLFEENGFLVEYLELVSRTYSSMKELFEFVAIIGVSGGNKK